MLLHVFRVCVCVCVCVTSRASTSCSPLEMLGMWMVVLKASSISISWRTSLRLVVPMISSLRPWKRRRTSDFNVFIQSFIYSYSSSAAFFSYQAHCGIKRCGKEKVTGEDRGDTVCDCFVHINEDRSRRIVNSLCSVEVTAHCEISQVHCVRWF